MYGNINEMIGLNEYIGARMARARKERGWSLGDMARLLNVTLSEVRKYEAGKDDLTIKELYHISRILKRPVEYFIQKLIIIDEFKDYESQERMQKMRYEYL